MQELTVQDPVSLLMAPDPIFADGFMSIRNAAQVLRKNNVSAVLVELGGIKSEVGMFSERDVVRAVADGVDVDAAAVSAFVSQPLKTVRGYTPIIEVAERLIYENIRHFAIESDGDITGVVSVRDVLQVVADKIFNATYKGA